MQLSFVETTWHGVPFDSIQREDGAGPRADISFYEAFYNRLAHVGEAPNAKWLRSKLNLATWIDATVLRPLAKGSPGSVRVLSLGAGLGVMEEVWVEKGYRVSVQECQPQSLKEFRERHPQVQVFLGDARHVEAATGSFDAIVMSAIDYVFDREEYLGLLQEVSRLLRNGGCAIMVSVSNLTLRGLLRSLKTRALNKIHEKSQANGAVLWGWMRTLSEHLRLGLRCGLRCQNIYIFDDQFEVKAVRRPIFARIVPTQSSRVGVLWSRE